MLLILTVLELNTSKRNKKNIDNKNIMGSAITKNIFRIQAFDSVMCAYFSIGFIDFML